MSPWICIGFDAAAIGLACAAAGFSYATSRHARRARENYLRAERELIKLLQDGVMLTHLPPNGPTLGKMLDWSHRAQALITATNARHG